MAKESWTVDEVTFAEWADRAPPSCTNATYRNRVSRCRSSLLREINSRRNNRLPPAAALPVVGGGECAPTQERSSR